MSSGQLARDPGESRRFQLERIEFESKRDHGGKASCDFILLSVVLFLFTRTKFLSFLVIGYFFGGMFVAAVLSIPTWLLKIWIGVKDYGGSNPAASPLLASF